MKTCDRCGQEFKLPANDDGKTNVCGNCADDLRQEAEAEADAGEELEDKIAKAQWEAEEAEKIARDRY